MNKTVQNKGISQMPLSEMSGLGVQFWDFRYLTATLFLIREKLVSARWLLRTDKYMRWQLTDLIDFITGEHHSTKELLKP